MKTVVAFFAFTALVFGQGFQGSLRGRVVDGTGAVVPMTKITLTDEGTSISRSSVANDQGEYTFASLTPATYSLSAEASGFKRAERKGLAVATQQSITFDVTLELGQVSDHINVTADSSLIETADASTGQFI